MSILGQYTVSIVQNWTGLVCKVPFNGKARGYRPESHMYLISLIFRVFSVAFRCSLFDSALFLDVKITCLFGL